MAQSALNFPADKPLCLSDLASALHDLLATLPPTSATLCISYEHQNTKRSLGCDVFEVNEPWSEYSLQRHLAFFRGRAYPERCPEEEMYKCRHCQFAGPCHGSGI